MDAATSFERVVLLSEPAQIAAALRAGAPAWKAPTGRLEVRGRDLVWTAPAGQVELPAVSAVEPFQYLLRVRFGGDRIVLLQDRSGGMRRIKPRTRQLGEQLRAALELPPPSAEDAEVGRKLLRAQAEARMRSAKVTMWVGGVIALVGAIATLVSLNMAQRGGRYFIFWGAIVFGTLRLLASWADFRTASRARREAEQPAVTALPERPAAAPLPPPVPGRLVAPPPPPPPPASQPAARRRLPAVAIAGFAAMVVVGVAVAFLLASRDDDEPASSARTTPAPATSVPSTTTFRSTLPPTSTSLIETIPPGTYETWSGPVILTGNVEFGSLNNCLQELRFHWTFDPTMQPIDGSRAVIAMTGPGVDAAYDGTTKGVDLDLTVVVPVGGGGGEWTAEVILVGDGPISFPPLSASFTGECIAT